MATLTADDIPVMLEDPEFQALPWTEQRDLTEQAIADAGSQMASSWTPDDYKAWGDFTTVARETVRSREGALGYVGRKVGDIVGGAADMGKALVQDVGTVGLAAGELVHPAGWEQDLPVGRALVKGFGAGLDHLGASGRQVMSINSDAEKALSSQLDALRGQLDKGDFPKMMQRSLPAGWVSRMRPCWTSGAATFRTPNSSIFQSVPPRMVRWITPF
jgi:hypothetical protein